MAIGRPGAGGMGRGQIFKVEAGYSQLERSHRIKCFDRSRKQPRCPASFLDLHQGHEPQIAQ